MVKKSNNLEKSKKNMRKKTPIFPILLFFCFAKKKPKKLKKKKKKKSKNLQKIT